MSDRSKIVKDLQLNYLVEMIKEKYIEDISISDGILTIKKNGESHNFNLLDDFDNGPMSPDDRDKIDSIEYGANKTIVDVELSSDSINPVQNNIITLEINSLKTDLNNKIDKVNGKGLSTNDYTTDDKNKLANIASGATKVIVDSSLSSTSTNAIQNKAVNSEINKIYGIIGTESIDVQINTTVNSAIQNLGSLSKKDIITDSELSEEIKESLDKADTALQSFTETDPTVPSWAKASVKPTYTASEVGADAKGTASSTVSNHNTDDESHSDIRLLIENLTNRVNTVANSTDTDLDQLSEIVAVIKSNKSIIENITTNKINVSDIINNLTTNVTNKPLSAAQGVVLKELIDTLQESLDTHTHTISEVSGLQSALDDKAASSHGTHVTYSSSAPVMDGTASTGSASTVARSDHKHPTDTSRASKSEFDTHVDDIVKHITSSERTNWGTAYTHSQAAHAPSDAEKNQNAFSNVKVGDTTITADSVTDTLTLVGDNITIIPDATNDKVTIGITKDNVTSALGYTPPTINTTYDVVSTSANGLAPKTDGSTSKFLRADGTWAVPPTGNTNYTLSSFGITATATELNYTDGVTSNIQTQLNSKASSTSVSNHTGNTTVHITSTERTNWGTAYTHSQAAHAPSNAQPNQNAFSNIAVGSTTIAADSTTDTLTLVGSNVTITPDATNDKVTIGITKTNVTNALGYTPPTTNTTYGIVSTSADGLAPKTDGSTSKYLRGDGTWVKPPNTTYSVVSTSANGLAPKRDGSTTKFLRGDGTWAVPPDTNTTYSVVSTDADGLVPKRDGSTSKFLRGDGTWATPSISYTHPSYTARTGVPTSDQTLSFGGTFSVSQPVSDSTGHITNINSRTITIPSTVATTSVNGLMSTTMVSKLNGIATGATKVTVDSSLSSTSTNAIQNKAVYTAVNNCAPKYTYGTTDLTAGSSSLATGTLYFVYE